MIPTYFTQIKSVIDGYAAANFVLDTNLTVESRPLGQGYMYGSIIFVDGSRFYFREYLNATSDNLYKLNYSYHYQDSDDHLIFRYDNAAHNLSLEFGAN